jgi:hypothetical protein
MAKKVVGEIKLQIAATKANPSPPVGPALGQKGVNIMEFCKAFNEEQKIWLVIIFQLLSLFMPIKALHLSQNNHQQLI